MKVAVLNSPMAHYSPLLGRFAQSMEGCGDEAVIMSPGDMRVPPDIKAAAVWGWRKGSLLKRTCPWLNILVLERGYVGDRFHWTSLGWNGLNGRATFPKPCHFETEPNLLRRWHATGAVRRPWRDVRQPGYALILGQVPSDMAVKGVNLPFHYQAWAAVLQRQGHKVKFRPHPKALRAHSGLPYRAYHTSGTLEEDLAGAKFTVSWNSNSSVDSILAGVPAVTFDRGSMAWRVSSHDLKNPVTMPSRADWAAQLAWCQWQPEELSSGHAWRAVREAMPK